MINNKWFCDPDPYRQRYCFFYVETENESDKKSIKSWKSGIGNIESIFELNQSKSKEEILIIQELIPQITAWRKNKLQIITEKEEIVPLLRTRIASLHIDEIMLSTINTVSLQYLIKQYLLCPTDDSLDSWCTFFHINDINNNKSELMRKILYKIIGLIPEEAIQ